MATPKPVNGYRSRPTDFGALEQRVYGIETSIRDQRAETNARFDDLSKDTARQVSQLASSITSLTNKIDEQQTRANDAVAAAARAAKTNWAAVLSAIGGVAIVAITGIAIVGGLAKSPLDASIARNEAAIARLIDRSVTVDQVKDVEALRDRQLEVVDKRFERFSDRSATKADVEEFKTRVDQRAALTRENELREFGRVEKDIDALRADQVSRSEHQARWRAQDDRINALSARLSDVQREFGSNYTLGDQVKNLQQQIQQLQNRLVSAPGGTGGR